MHDHEIRPIRHIRDERAAQLGKELTSRIYRLIQSRHENLPAGLGEYQSFMGFLAGVKLEGHTILYDQWRGFEVEDSSGRHLFQGDEEHVVFNLHADLREIMNYCQEVLIPILDRALVLDDLSRI
ncbi:MAG: hypothetical protein AB7L09_02270 [Nitrospira sp.]